MICQSCGEDPCGLHYRCRFPYRNNGPAVHGSKLMADEIDRLRKMLADHGIDPDGEYIGPNGLRVDAPASKETVKF